MFTANSMNCLTEALGLALPGNGTVLATHADRKELFLEAGRRIVDLAKRHYEHDDATVLPRGIATFDAFENAMTLDIAMGGSTNTVLHLLAAAHEAQVPFTMPDIDRLSRRVPHLCKVRPVHARTSTWKTCIAPAASSGFWASSIARAYCIGKPTQCIRPRSGAAIEKFDIARPVSAEVETLYRAAPAGIRTTVPFSQNSRYGSVDRDRERGVIRGVEHAFSKDGGLAVLYGNIAEDGCIVKTAGVDASNLVFAGPARIFESQDDAVAGILGDKVAAGDVVVIRYEGPKGGPGMQEMLYPTSYLKSKGLGKHAP